MKLTEEDIDNINRNAPDDQGVFLEPFGVPIDVKGLCVYMRWDSYGYSGGNCWGNSAERYENDAPNFEVLDMVLEKLKPDLTYLQFKEIDSLIIDSTDNGRYEYYGNQTTYEMKMIVLDDLIEYLKGL